MDRIEEKIISIIDAHAEELKAIALDIYNNAEQGYYEYRTSKLVSDFLKKLGLTTTEDLAITGLRASIEKETGPNVALIGELDGIACPAHPHATEKGYSHACGHNDQIVAMLGAALALTDKEVAESLGGTATFFAVPAEEFQGEAVNKAVKESHGILCGGGKCELIREGAFDDIDMSITTHSLMVGRGEGGPDLMLGNSACNGFIGKSIIMKGRAAHAAAAPHLGVNALNAATLALTAIGMIRETFQEKDCVRVHPYIRKGGTAINVVPDEAIIDLMVRANTQEVIEQVCEKVDNCCKGAAMAIGCDVEIIDSQGYMPCPERAPEQVLWDSAALMGDNLKVESIPLGKCNTASTDVGDLFSIMPVMNFTFGGSVGDLHSVDYKITDDNIAHIMPAKMMAILAYRLLKDGAKEAKAIIDDYKAPMTPDDYREYVAKFQK